MINKIKEMMKLSESIQELKKEIMKQASTVKESAEQVGELNKVVKDMKNSTTRLQKLIIKEIDNIQKERTALCDELYEFRLFKKEAAKQFSRQVNSEFSAAREALKKNINEFNETKKQLDTKLDKIEQLDHQINRLTQITKGINGRDFELSKHKEEMKKEETEKIRLLRRIDSLERLVAKLRRRVA